MFKKGLSNCHLIPGMIELPGSFSGNEISPSPQRGPDPRNLKSLAIFIKDTAITLSAPDTYLKKIWIFVRVESGMLSFTSTIAS